MQWRTLSNQFSDVYQKTIGVDFLEKALRVDTLGRTVRLQLWDTAGQEEFDALTRSYYRGAKAAVLVFSTSDVASLEALPQWKAKVEEECGSVAMALVQNKCDLLSAGGVGADAAEAMARRLGLRVYRTCVCEGLNCDAGACLP
ncbi:hypothetical protein WJX81_001404 [Elliptochloris bilobata]|uniref:Ras-related protein Rab-23 n=1 Tax=Elliptochloris bilobata TaxID=381761 RepID=A0AAW1S2G9_9CHLO